MTELSITGDPVHYSVVPPSSTSLQLEATDLPSPQHIVTISTNTSSDINVISRDLNAVSGSSIIAEVGSTQVAISSGQCDTLATPLAPPIHVSAVNEPLSQTILIH